MLTPQRSGGDDDVRDSAYSSSNHKRPGNGYDKTPDRKVSAFGAKDQKVSDYRSKYFSPPSQKADFSSSKKRKANKKRSYYDDSSSDEENTYATTPSRDHYNRATPVKSSSNQHYTGQPTRYESAFSPVRKASNQYSNYTVEPNANKKVLAERSNINKKLDFYHRMTDPDWGKNDDSDSDKSIEASDNRYGRRRNNGPIKPVHNRDVKDSEPRHFAYEPVSKKDNIFTPERRPGTSHMTVDRRDAFERVSTSNFMA